MKVKEFKDQKLLTVRMSVYSIDRDKLVKTLEEIGVGTIIVENDIYVMFKTNLKKLLKIEEAGLFTFDQLQVKINRI